MKINGFQYPNPNKGYTTEITMDFYTVVRGNGEVSHLDTGKSYDGYICKCKVVLTEAELTQLRNNVLDNNGNFKLIPDDGFYPFGVGVKMPVDGFDVKIINFKDNGVVDNLAKSFEVDITFAWAYSQGDMLWETPPVNYCKLGNMSIMGLDNIRFPKISPSDSGRTVSQWSKGGNIDTILYNTDNWKTETKLELILRNDILHNLLYRIVNTYRGGQFFVQDAGKYFIFSSRLGDGNSYPVKLSNGKIKLTYDNFEETKLSMELVKDI